ncbi:hypothetical protein CYMTET_22658 [Cymbomonas tetramitiformis]|uniref:Uncharacterized protein n=1 Tax=Cymbomonas tetramitiformis TaxID=36881 RepID=A0AAE0L1Q9_9CHLO|nr:hypothetical protein CYMTET_22658 [Cymbomonas tetramitiformis]
MRRKINGLQHRPAPRIEGFAYAEVKRPSLDFAGERFSASLAFYLMLLRVFVSAALAAARKTLRYSPPLVVELASWYHELQLKEFQRANGKPYEDTNPLPPLNRQSYLVLGLQLGAIFCPQVKEKDLYAELDADWMLETGGRNVMNLICFQDAMFEFLDTWCPSVKLQDYLDLVASARNKLKEAEKPGAAKKTFRKITRTLLLCATKPTHKKNKFKASVQQAMTRHYAEPIEETVAEEEELEFSSGSNTDDGNSDCKEESLSPSGALRPASGHGKAPSEKSAKRRPNKGATKGKRKGDKAKDHRKAGAASLSGASASEERESAVRVPLELSHNEEAALFAVEWPSSGSASPSSQEAMELPSSIHHPVQERQASHMHGRVHGELSAPLQVIEPGLSRVEGSAARRAEKSVTLQVIEPTLARTGKSAIPRTERTATLQSERTATLQSERTATPRTEKSATLRTEKSGSLQTDRSATARTEDSSLPRVADAVPPRVEESTLPQTRESATPRTQENRVLIARVARRASRRWVLAQRRGAVMAANAAREVLQRYESHPMAQLLQSDGVSLVDNPRHIEVLAEASRMLKVLREAARSAMKAAKLANKAEATEDLAEAVTAVRNAELQATACGSEMEKLLSAHEVTISAKLDEVQEGDQRSLPLSTTHTTLSTTAGAEVEMHQAKTSFPRGVRSVVKVRGGSEAEHGAGQRHSHTGDQLCEPRPDALHRSYSREVSEIPAGAGAEGKAEPPPWALDGADSRESSSQEGKKVALSLHRGFKSDSDSSSDWEAGWNSLLLNHKYDDDDDDDDSDDNDYESDFDDADGGDNRHASNGKTPRSTRGTAPWRPQGGSQQRPADGAESKSAVMTTTAAPRQVGQVSSASASTSGAVAESAAARSPSRRQQKSSRRKQPIRELFKVDPKKSGRLEAMLQVLGQMSDENGVSGAPDAFLFGGGRRRPRGKAPRVFKGSDGTSHVPQGVPGGDGGLKILVAVPEESIQAAVSMLAYLGHLKVYTAVTSIELMYTLGKVPQGLYHLDVLIVDEELASMDGVNILQELENIWPRGQKQRAWVVVTGMEKDESHPRKSKPMYTRFGFDPQPCQRKAVLP